MKKSSFDVFGNIILVKFSRGVSALEKKRTADKLLKEHKSVRTILEKTQGFKGRLRKQETRWVSGEKTKEVLYRENGCVFRFDIDKTYFSPRLSNERKEISKLIRKGDSVLVMFAGVAPFPIVIAKNSKAKVVYSNEINREANRYAEMNIGLNKLKGRVILLPGDVKRVAKNQNGKKFDVIVMARPQLKDMFLKEAFALSKKGTRIYYYGFCKEEDTYDMIEDIASESNKAKKKIKVTGIKKAGEIGTRKFRMRVDIVVQ